MTKYNEAMVTWENTPASIQKQLRVAKHVEFYHTATGMWQPTDFPRWVSTTAYRARPPKRVRKVKLARPCVDTVTAVFLPSEITALRAAIKILEQKGIK